MTRWTSLSVCLAVAAALLIVAPQGVRSQDATVRVRLIAFNDFHGHLEAGENEVQVQDPADPARSVALRSGGAAHLAALIGSLRAEQPRNVVVSTGDLIGASPLVSGLFHDEPTIEVMNAIGLDVNAAGNHEFDQGVAELQRIVTGGCRDPGDLHRKSCSRGRYAGARFPFLAANVVDRTTGRAVFPSTFVTTLDGVRIGFIGVVTRATPGIVIPSGVAGVRFLSEARVLNEQARLLQAVGVQAIVAVVHEGGHTDGGFNGCSNPRGPIFEIVRELEPAIDVVLSAHTHRGYNCEVNGKPVMQGASFGRLVSVVDLAIDRVSGDVVPALTRARNLPVPNGTDADDRLRSAYPPLAPDPTVAAIVEHYRAASAPLANRPVGRIAGPFERRPGPGGDHALGRLIADAQLAATRVNGATIAFTNPGGVRSALHASGTDGTVTYADAYSTQPFGNSLVTMTITGEQLKTLLEQQWSASSPERARILQPSAGLSYSWSGRKPYGQRIESLRLDGRAVQQDDDVRVTVNSYLAAGGDGFRVLQQGRDRIGGPLDIDALTEFLRVRSAVAPLAPSSAQRIARSD
jgi:5'-nucleotidase